MFGGQDQSTMITSGRDKRQDSKSTDRVELRAVGEGKGLSAGYVPFARCVPGDRNATA